MQKTRTLSFVLLLSLLCFEITAQNSGKTSITSTQTTDCYPTHWWPAMQWNKVQILVRGTSAGFNLQEVKIDYPGITLDRVHRLENEHYYALDITIAPNSKPGTVVIELAKQVTVRNKRIQQTTKINWELKPRREGKGSTYAQGVTSEDLMYLIMPDRFSNGDPSNDRIAGMRDQSLNRDTVFNRHGGDLQGIINHLDYFEKMGITALWLNPVLENDRPERTEHGYAFTDHYKIDRRLGGEDKYKELIDKMHAKGLKMIQDAVYNHVDEHHVFVMDKPTNDFLHNWPKYTNTTFKDQVLMDPYASEKDKKVMSDGWFTTQMPDLNQHNPYVATFLIQHALWTVEEFGIDAWRIDTYAYNDLEFMNRCNKALLDEYPKLYIFGETWVHGVINQAFFAENTLAIPFKSNLPSVTDFQTNMYGIIKAVNEPFGWTEGVNRLYSTLSTDFLYDDPMKLVIFLDNHDIPRFFSVVDENIQKMKTGMAWLLTCRGIPQLYYGGEILMPGFTSPNDGFVRKDFPGGWVGDSKNAFTGAGMTSPEKDFQQYTQQLALFRKNSSAIKTGRMMQYLPENGLYVYFRYDEKQTVMVVMNTSNETKKVNAANYTERTTGFTKAEEVTGAISTANLSQTMEIPAMTTWVFELK